MLIMVSGPYKGSSTDPKIWDLHLQQMNEAALAVFQKGHIPIIGVNNALPLIAVAGAGAYESIMMPVSMALAERCDGVLRIGGASAGADQEVQLFAKKGLPIFHSLEEIPPSENH
jgi:hypothetical protein